MSNLAEIAMGSCLFSGPVHRDGDHDFFFFRFPHRYWVPVAIIFFPFPLIQRGPERLSKKRYENHVKSKDSKRTHLPWEMIAVMSSERLSGL